MCDALSHRGPDDAGLWNDPRLALALGHRRLSVLELSALGHQPMSSTGDRYVVTYNGEIYNWLALRQELTSLGHSFRSRSDTEVILAAFLQWGIRPALQRFNGMFALAVWDRDHRSLTLARDRIGEKPLYYGVVGGSFTFASELKPFRGHGPLDIDRTALAHFLRHSYVPAPLSIYSQVRKLRAGHILTVPAGAELAASVAGLPASESFWSILDFSDRSLNQEKPSAEENYHDLRALATDSVRLRSLADVPVGAFLSGGIDSSLVVALMQSETTSRVKTFTVGFDVDEFDESAQARAVAERLGTEHVEIVVTPAEAMAIIPDIPSVYDEPFADESQIPTILMSRLARTAVTACVSGDGGDELFGGYDRYRALERFWRRAGRFPAWSRRAAGAVVDKMPDGVIDGASFLTRPIVDRFGREGNVVGKVRKATELFASSSPGAAYTRLISRWSPPEELLLNRDGLEPIGDVTLPPAESLQEELMLADILGYLPDNCMVKLDRASMSVSLEARTPLLDHRMVELAVTMPLEEKANGHRGKLPLRRMLGEFLPASMIDRPKKGFGVPVGEWLRGPLRPWAESLLAANRFEQCGSPLDSEKVSERWQQHLAGRNWTSSLWTVLMFQAWLENQ